MKKGVKYIQDIIKEVAQEEGRSKEEIKELWRIHREFVKDKIEEEDTFILKIPQIGNLFYSSSLQRLFNNKSRGYYSYLDGKSLKIDNLIEDAKTKEGKTKYLYPQKRGSTLYKFYKAIQRVIYNRKKSYTARNEVYKELEKYSYGQK